MTEPRSTLSSRLHRSTGIATALLLPSLLVISGITYAESLFPVEAAAPSEAVAVPQQPVELRVYKQRFEIGANVQCRVPNKGPSYCIANIGSEIAYHIEPELILKYTSIKLDEQEFAAETTPQGMLKFRTNKVNYSGQQNFEVEVIYLK
jgi:hypothetical protein